MRDFIAAWLESVVIGVAAIVATAVIFAGIGAVVWLAIWFFTA